MILVVDNDLLVARSLCRLLTAAGYPCRHVQGAAEALAAVRSHPAGMPLLVMLDQDMPGMTGVAVLRALRADPATRQMPVVFHSGHRGAAAREEAMALGALAWLDKGAGHVPDTFKVVTESYERSGGVRGEPGTATDRR
jgi:CheY-like chemotaxis protein